MTTTYIVTNAFAASVLEIKNPWLIVNVDCVVGAYEGRAAARAAKANGLVGKTVSLKEITLKIADAVEEIPVEEVVIEEISQVVEEVVIEEIVVEETPVEEIVVEEKMSHKSTATRPCRLVWDLADSMPNSRRKDVIAAAEAKGVAFYTARTQYQLWTQVQKEMAAREKLAAK